ncbi:hypothetical protein GCM10027435_11260 [Haloparvum alkalitolerans]
MTGGSGGPTDAPALPDPEPPDGVRLRTATPADELDVRRVLDGAMLEVADEAVATALAAGTALVALAERPLDRDPAVAGALLVTAVGDADAAHLDAVAVRRSRRGRGVGTALVARALADAAAAGHDRMTAAYDASLREFYADLGFSATPIGERGGESRDESGGNDAGDGASDGASDEEGADADRLRGIRPLPAGGHGCEGERSG